MSQRDAVWQVVDTLAPGTAVSNCLLWAHEILLTHGYIAGIRAHRVEAGLKPPKPPGAARRGGALLIYHFSVGSPMTEWIERRARRDRIVLWYHNLTPSHYFRAADPFLAGRLEEGRAELRRLAQICCGAIADSSLNASELRELGYSDVRVVPPVSLDERYELAPAPGVLELGRSTGRGDSNWLFVGRLVPNKRQDEIVAAFAAFRRLQPQARLFLVGAEGASLTYRRWLENQVAYLGLGDAVHLVGQVSQAELNAYYRIADCFVSMSEHEGFGVPLVESMYFNVPVIAYAAAAVPETLGDAGILLSERDPFLVAEVAHLLTTDKPFREAIVARQRRRLADFAPRAVNEALLSAVRSFVDAG